MKNSIRSIAIFNNYVRELDENQNGRTNFILFLVTFYRNGMIARAQLRTIIIIIIHVVGVK